MPLLEQGLATDPAREWGLSADQLSPPISPETPTAVIAWPEAAMLFLPKYACWVHLLEPWWKQRRSLALKGRRCADVAAIIEAVVQGTAYGNQHRSPYVWKKAM
jgi:hypothetical protein